MSRFVFAPLSLAALAAPVAAHAVVLTCAIGMNQYYPDNNPAFKTIILNTGTHTVIDGNGQQPALFSADESSYQFSYTKAGSSYKYIVIRATGDMNLLHAFKAANGANYRCQVYRAAPKF